MESINKRKRVKLDLKSYLNCNIEEGLVEDKMGIKVMENERKLMGDILYVLQGINGNQIKINSEMNGVIYERNNDWINVNPTLAKIALRCCDAGIHYKLIDQFLSDCSKNEKSGVIKKRFCSIVRRYLNDHLKFISQTEQRVNTKTSTTILNLYVEVKPLINRLSRLAFLCRNIKISDKKGGSLFSYLYETMLNATLLSDFSKMALEIFEDCTDPFSKHFFDWVLNGHLNDPFNEFFIQKSIISQNINNHKQNFIINYELLPIFIPTVIAKKILQIGSTIHYINGHLNSNKSYNKNSFEFSSESYLEPSKQSVLKDGLDFRDLKGLKKAVCLMEESLSNYFLHILFDDFSFLGHFQNIRSLLLHSQSDFSDSLLKSSISIMSLNKRRYESQLLNPLIQNSLIQLTQNNTFGIIKTSLNFTLQLHSIKNPKDIDVLDAFGLEYKLNEKNPLQIVFTPKSTEMYHKIFNFLWKMRYSLKLLSQVNSKGMEFKKRKINAFRNGKNSFKTILKLVAVLCFRMQCVLSRLQQSFFYNGVEYSFRIFIDKCKASVTIDGIVENHSKMLNCLYERLFLTKMQFYHLIICLFKVAIVFSKQSLNFYEAITTEKKAENSKELLEGLVHSYVNNKKEFENYVESLLELSRSNGRQF